MHSPHLEGGPCTLLSATPAPNHHCIPLASQRFDFVVGVFLNSLGHATEGNLWVRPGSHLAERETSAARADPNLERQDPAAPDVGGVGVDSAPLDPASNAIPILCPSGGSVIVFDKDLWHAGGPNLSADIRYALYYRMRFEAE